MPTDGETKMNGHENGGDSNKRPKLNTMFQEILAPDVVEREDEVKKAYLESAPYSHAHMQRVFRPEFLRSVKEEIKSHTKVKFKESDLFRVYQSIDMANLEPGSELSIQLPHVMKLRELLYSQEWRSFIEGLAGLPPSTLTSQIDCACNCHAPGCHLLCHDDVIGTRKVSYIMYLTEEDWKPEEGGSLELYEPQNDEPSSNPLPVARVWPAFNSMAFFVVEPGASFHAVQEVLGDRPRLSLQGWYHAAEPPKNIELATLQQLKARSDDQAETSDEDLQFNFDSETTEFTEQDKEYLRKYVKAEYLTKESMQEMRKCFEKDSSVQLRNFLLDKWVPKMEPKKSIVYDDSYYKSGISSEWKLTGPAHKQRYLEYEPATSNSTDCCPMAGALMHHVKQKVFESEQMARYLKALTSLEKPTGIRSGKIRRFRPGLDYTVAHYGLLVNKSVLDATMCFVYDENDDRDAWESGDVGGFECYIEADDDDDNDGGGGAEEGSGPADEYNEDDETELLSVSASNNTLSLVFRDPGTMRFVKYVGSSAPSSRYDICMEYALDANDEEDAASNDEDVAAKDDSKEDTQ
jgi:Rps23 Pro-64 3,4-dihydroxylase Tpa1-like proline 4-hydroxylase